MNLNGNTMTFMIILKISKITMISSNLRIFKFLVATVFDR